MGTKRKPAIVVHQGGAVHHVNPLKQYMESMWIKQSGFCFWCGRQMVRKTMYNADGSMDGYKATIDHRIPLAMGGKNDPDNLVAACNDCNSFRARHMVLPLGQQLREAEDKVRSLEAKALRTHEAALLQSQQYKDLRTALHISENRLPPTCTCWYCRTISRILLWTRRWI